MAIIQVKASPNAARTAIAGWQGDCLKIRLHAAPEKGKANDELVEFLSETLDVPKSRIRVVSGHTSRLKKVEIEGKTLEQIKTILME